MGVLHVVADVLSIITITLCLVLKIPQILSLMKVKNTQGINLYGLLLELSSYTIMACYNYTNNYALLSYMEYPIILVQEIVLIYLVLKYMGLISVFSMGCFALYGGITSAFLTGLLPKTILTFLAPLCTPVSASSKVVQLAEIIRKKNADSVSLLTWFLSAFTNFTRVFTIYMDSADLTLLSNFGISVFLSSSILGAAAYYQRQRSLSTKLD